MNTTNLIKRLCVKILHITELAKPMACDTFMCKLISSEQSKLMKYSRRVVWLKLRSNASESGPPLHLPFNRWAESFNAE